MANEVVEIRPALVAGHRPTAIVPQTMDETYRLAKAVCAAGMAPRGLDTPEKAMVAIMHGLEVGLTPMAALQRIAVVNGRPTIWGDGAIGLVRASGLCEYVNETVEGEGDARVALCEVKRRGEKAAVVRTFSVGDAKTAGLWNKRGRDGQPTPWQQYPDRMLAMRARAFALRDVFADVLGGLHVREEIEEDAPKLAPPTPPTPPAPPPAAAIEPPKPPTPPAPPAPPAPPSARSSEPYGGPPVEEPKPARDWIADFDNDLASATSAAAFDELAGPYLEELGGLSMAERTKAQAVYERYALKWSEIAP